MLGGWREATQVGFYGIGTDTSEGRPHELPLQAAIRLGALDGLSDAQISDAARRRRVHRSGRRNRARAAFPSVETRYTPETLARAGREVTYLHTQGTVGLDWRTSPGYARRGGFYGATLHDYNDRDDVSASRWPNTRPSSTSDPARGLGALVPRPRPDRVRQGRSADPVLHAAGARRRIVAARLQQLALPRPEQPAAAGEWRIMVNRYLDMAFFYDAGKVAAAHVGSRLRRLKDDYGFGLRFHGPFATPLRVELAKEPRRLAFIFSSSAPLSR